MRFRRRRGLGGGPSRKGGQDDDDASGEGAEGRRPGGGGGGSGLGAVLSSDVLTRGLVALGVLALLFGAGYLTSAWWLFPASTPEAAAGEVVEVPDLVGLDDEQARESLEEAGLDYLVRSEMPHREAPEGAVVAQSPLPGQLARPGAPVEVTLSEGPLARTVPDLHGLSRRQAAVVLERLGFRTSTDSASSQLERGRTVGTRPEAGTRETLPAEVVVVVSRGPEVADVPELVGLHVDDVRARLRDLELRLGEITYDPDAFAAPGRVIGQTPSPGFALRTGGRVSVRVAGSAPAPGSDTLPEDAPTEGPGPAESPPDSARPDSVDGAAADSSPGLR